MIRTSAARGCRVGWLLLTTAMLGCGGGGGGVPGVPDAGPTNHAPTVVASATPTGPVLMGQATQLSAVASDPDGDPLSYSWAQTSPASPQGTFGARSSSSTTWTAPTVSAATSFTLTVTVSDGRGGIAPGPVIVFAKTSTAPSFIADVQPLLIQCFGGCHFNGINEHPLADYTTMLSYHTTIECSGDRLVKPGDPDNSVLIKATAGTSCGERMPPNGPYLTTDQLDLVRTWISNGAAEN